MEKFYLTFGTKYRHEPHPHWPGADPDGWVLIEASDEGQARSLAMSAFGPYWSMLYEARRFDEIQNRLRYYRRGQIGWLHQSHETDVPLRFSTSQPEYYGEESAGHLGNRVEGRLLPDHDPMPGMYDVEYFHDPCLEAGMEMFETVTEIDANVLNSEMDWANPWKCQVCGRNLNA